MITTDRLDEIEREARERLAYVETTAARMGDARTGRVPDVGIVPALCRTIIALCADVRALRRKTQATR